HLEAVTQPLLMLGRLRPDFDAQRIEFRVIVKMAPQARRPIENNSPFGFGRNSEKGVRTCRQLLTFDERISVEGDVGRLVGSSAPEPVVWHELAPDLPFVDLRAAVCDRDLQRSDLLSNFATWAGPGRHSQSPSPFNRFAGQKSFYRPVEFLRRFFGNVSASVFEGGDCKWNRRVLHFHF